MSQLPTIISEPQSADADTQDGKDGEEGVEKEAETYENVFEYLNKGCYPQGASKAEIVIGFVPLVLSRHAVIVRHASLVPSVPKD